MSTWLIFVLITLATHRVTRLITRDALPIIATPREAFVQRWGGFSDAKTPAEKKLSLNGKKTNIVMKSIAYLWECDWCMSVWVGGALTYAAWQWLSQFNNTHPFAMMMVWLSASSIAGLIAQREPN